ncbi:MAG: DUF6364 family protein [Gammaproteobacteria bacterium]|nr:DUF6364 family protein [Gammaproteobacteria bacterium]
MKNITLSIDEEVLAEVRRYAAERKTSVNALVRDYLTRTARHADRASQARKRIRELSEQSQARLDSVRFDRDALHER